MIIIETQHHFTFSSENCLPHFSCAGDCKKSWWPNDNLPAIQVNNSCPTCGGCLRPALEGLHYIVTKNAPRALQLDDFSTTLPMDKTDKRQIEMLLSNNVSINNLSVVKPEFEAKAKSSWAKQLTLQ